MKKITTTLLGLCLSTALMAQTYQAPKIEFDGSKKQEVKVVSPSSESWRSNYKVQQTPGPERNVASDEHMWLDDSEKAEQKSLSRDPSSVEASPSAQPHVKPWIWIGK